MFVNIRSLEPSMDRLAAYLQALDGSYSYEVTYACSR